MITNEYIKNVKNKNWPRFNKRVLQRDYYEHVILNENDLNKTRRYINENVLKWEMDDYFVKQIIVAPMSARKN